MRSIKINLQLLVVLAKVWSEKLSSEGFFVFFLAMTAKVPQCGSTQCVILKKCVIEPDLLYTLDHDYSMIFGVKVRLFYFVARTSRNRDIYEDSLYTYYVIYSTFFAVLIDSVWNLYRNKYVRISLGHLFLFKPLGIISNW